MKKLILSLSIILSVFFANAQVTSVTNTTNPTCFGLCDGVINLQTVGGIPPFTYVLYPNPNLPQVSTMFAGLCAGSYTIVCTDANNNTNTIIATLTNPTPISVNLTNQIIPNCGQCNGTATIISSGGTPPYTFSSLPQGPQIDLQGNMSGLCAATVYTITVTDANICSNMTSIILGTPPLNLNISSQINPCGVNCNGQATVLANGGTTPYVFNIFGTNSPQIDNLGNASGLCSGSSYTVSITDANSCSQTILLAPFSNSLSISNFDSIICGVQTPITAICNSNSMPITYSIQPGNFNNTTGIFNVVTTNTYTITAVDAALCSLSIIYTSNPTTVSNALLGVICTSISYDESCVSSQDGGINVTCTPSNNLTYLWNTGDTLQDVLNKSSGNYWVKIANSLGNCQILNDTINNLINNCGSISGVVYDDSLSNCIYDAGDFFMQNIPISLSTGDSTFTNLSGYYEFNNVPFGTHTIFQTSMQTNNCLQPNIITLNSVNNVSANNNFIDTFIYNFDLSINIWSNQFIAASGLGQYDLFVYNNSQYPVLADIKLKLDDSVTYLNSLPLANNIFSTQNGDSLTWNSTLLPGGNYFTINVNYSNTIPIFTNLNSIAKVTPLLNIDVDSTNNIYNYNNIIAASFDPNDKSVSPTGFGVDGNILLQDSVLDYTIRFQNTGNAPAQNIVVVDTLTQKLDPSTIKILYASHNYVIDIENGNIIKFIFKNILLPDSNANEPASHGKIVYRIKQKNTNQLGDVINNSASIYFDYNDPIKTNTTVNTIWQPLSVFDYKTSALKISPNPMNKNCIITLPQQLNNAHLEIFNSIGQAIFEDTFDGNTYEFKNKAYPKGNYFIKINTENGKQFTGKLLIE